MAKAKVSLVKKAARKPMVRATGKPAAVSEFIFVDNQDNTLTVNGVDAAGNPVDISSVATIVASSDSPTIISVDPPTGMTFAMHALGPLTTPGTPAQISVTATWTDGSVGPFSFSLPVDVVTGPATGVVIVPGIPTSH